ncbi:small membrane protein [Klebsiella pneumoniae]|uniref:small membrane protein n=1 Tax=Klebsiella pneumoniae TaxID=573 RepID=UPI0035C7766F
MSTYISRDYTCMANLLILALAVVLFLVAVLSFVSYTKGRKKLKNTFKKRY